MRRGGGWLLGGLLAVVLVAGCGGPPSEEAAPPEAPPAAEQPATEQPAPAAMPKGDAAAGKTEFLSFCSACHGPDAKGLPKLGKNLVTSQFVAEKTDAELLAYVKRGRPVDDPLNTTGVPMPPKGGNPALNDQQIADIIAYIRTIHVH